MSLPFIEQTYSKLRYYKLRFTKSRDDIPHLIKTVMADVYGYFPQKYQELAAISLTETVVFAASAFQSWVATTNSQIVD